MKRNAKQSGMGVLGFLIVLGLIAFFTLIALRLAPIYIEYFNVVTSLKSLKNEPEFASKTQAEIMQLLTRRLEVNDVEHVAPNDIAIKQGPRGTWVGINYEVRTPLLGNIDVVVKFNDHIEVAVLEQTL